MPVATSTPCTADMFSIARITLREIRLPLKEPFQISSGVTTERRILLVELRDADGVDAWGECVAGEQPHYSPETVDTAWLAIHEWLAPLVLGRKFEDPRQLSRTLEIAIRGHLMAKAALEMTSWGLVARLQSVALAELLGGSRDRIATGISLGIQQSPNRLVEQAVRAREQGYQRIKLKIKPGADVEYVAAVRDALGSDTPLTVDANSAYTPDDLEVLRGLDAFGLVMIEQPLARDDLVRHAALQRQLTTPICLDESITGPDRAEDMITLGSGKIINIKPGRVGGLTRAIAVHDVAAHHDIPVWCGGMLESGIARAYNVALASLPNFKLPGDLSPSARYWERDIVTPAWTMNENGWVAVPRDAPGLGVTIDMDRIDDLTVQTASLEAA